jgi:hypothetical protein
MGRQFRVSISKPETHPRDMTRPSTSESSQEVNGTEEAFRQFVPKGRPVPASKPNGPRHTNVPIRRGPTFLYRDSGIQEFKCLHIPLTTDAWPVQR